MAAHDAPDDWPDMSAADAISDWPRQVLDALIETHGTDVVTAALVFHLDDGCPND